jgi:adenylyltransferase/sulfurtransferase
MLAINPLIQVTPHAERVTASNVLALVQAYDVIIDATDSFATRYMLNDACVLTQKPLVYGAIFRFEGQASVFAPHLGGSCYRCLFPDPPTADLAPNCAQTGVFGVLPGVVGTVQATEALKLILGIGQTLVGRLWLYDALRMQADTWAIAPNPTCPRCGTAPTLTDIIDMEAVCAAPLAPHELSVTDAAQRLEATLAPLLLDVRDDHEYAAGHLADAQHIPVDELGMRLSEVATNRDIIVYCRSGMRSARACALLRQHGYAAQSLAGGLLAWRQQIDATLDVV